MAQIDFTKYSFEALVAELTELVAAKGSWNDANSSSTGQVLIQLVAQMTDQLMYMLERRTEENFIPTARLETSVGALANLLGYRPVRKVSSEGTATLTLVDGSGNPITSSGTVTIPKYTKVTFDTKEFLTKDEQILPNTTVYPVNFQIIEGTLETRTFDPTDITATLFNDGYVLIDDYKDIAENSLFIFTDTQTFSDVRFPVGSTPAIGALSFAASTDQAYDLRITNDGIRILFGDGTNGEKPTGTLTIQWIKSSGKDVNVTGTGLTFAFESTTLGDDVIVIPANAYEYTLTNSTAIDGGLDAETLTQTKARAPDYVRTAARAVTREDYEFWSKQSAVGGIVDSRAYGEEEIGINVLNMNNVYIVYLLNDGTAWDTTEQQEFRDYMAVYKTLTSHMVLLQAETIPLQININIKRSTALSASNSEVYNTIKEDFIDFFSFKDGSLGTDVYHSELVDRYHNMTINKDGIDRLVADYVKIDVKALKSFTLPITTQSISSTITYGSDGDTYRITINGTDYDYVSSNPDDADAVATALAALVDADADVTATATLNVINIATATTGTTFTITNTGTTTPLNNRIDIPIQLPVSLLNNDSGDQLFLPSNIEIIETDGTVIATDDGAGTILNGTINYVSGVMAIPIQASLPNANYYVRYKQTTNQNMIATEKQALDYSQPKASYTDTTELLSTIQFV